MNETTPHAATKRGSFTGKIGFVLAAAGSAVGLGNIWRFPYLAAKYGGGIFLLVYILLSLTFGFSLMIAEIAIGRKTGKSPVSAFKSLDHRFAFLGYLAAAIPAIILPYYSVIGGWVTKYAFGFLLGEGGEMAKETYFGGFISQPFEPVLWFLLFVALTALVVLFGVQKGVEKVSKFMMPVLIMLMIFIVIYMLATTDGAGAGVAYYLKPDFSKFSVMTVVAAMGQLFYSMSLAMGIMITYGSYMKKEISIERSVHQIEIFDTGVAILAGLLIVPACYAFSGGDPAALGKGPSLMFGVLPQVFERMPGGGVIGFVFFVTVLLAALTSSISLMETVVSTLMDKFKWDRKLCCLAVLGVCLLLGLPSSLGYSAWSSFKVLGMQILDLFDFISNSIMMPLLALITCVFVGFVIKPSTVVEEIECSGKFGWRRLFTVTIRYVAPVFLLAILISSVLDAFGIVKI
ncbi:MAG: sodium-dependent transporter [Ruminococcaceae bacterium]|nr:sodium-dependent transporter [Oscillospiraceae bacterium]